MKVATITSPVSNCQFDELVNRFGECVRRDGGSTTVVLNHFASKRTEAEFLGIAKHHGYTFTIREAVNTYRCLACGMVRDVEDPAELPEGDEHCSHEFEPVTAGEVAEMERETGRKGEQ